MVGTVVPPCLQDCYIRDLESRLSALELSRGAESPAHGGRVQELETRCQALQSQVNEMEVSLTACPVPHTAPRTASIHCVHTLRPHWTQCTASTHCPNAALKSKA